ncbi:MAG: hypothetical protein ACK4SI_09725, partial [Brevundimonas aurantiaca]|uniref:hypothetical protein n=1 Tax=Brevundimonas aurantiaca TaxID=74316 RepID=UPI00391C03A9
AGLLRWLMAAQTGLLPTQPITAQINLGLSLWLDEKRGSRQVRRNPQQEGFGRTNAASMVGRNAEIGFLDEIFCVLGAKAKPQTAAEPVAIPSIESS